jgi:polar amino acid transport system ATP-binding protein
MAMPEGDPTTAGTGHAPAEVADHRGASVSMQGVTKAFGDNVVLDQLDLEVRGGEKLVIIGPSGSGKTTILRVLMTLEQPDEGVIQVGGEYLYHVEKGGKLVPAKPKDIRRVRRKIGMVFQHFNLFPHMTVLRNITLAPRKVLDISKEEADERGRKLLGMVGLADKVDAYPAELSGGQKQRVAIARALAMQPDLLLFDEVTSALDPELVGEVLNVLRTLATETDVTMLLVTHEMEFAREIGDRVVMFDRGKVVEAAAPAELFSNPREERTRSFLRAVLGN